LDVIDEKLRQAQNESIIIFKTNHEKHKMKKMFYLMTTWLISFMLFTGCHSTQGSGNNTNSGGTASISG
jgi:hypothetical protein